MEWCERLLDRLCNRYVSVPKGAQEIMAISFLARWKEIKSDYEEATDKKKPSDKFLGVFKKKSKLEPTLTALDAALKKREPDDAREAHEKFEAAAAAYQKTLFKAVAAEEDKEIKQFTQILMKKLDDMVEDSETSWKTVAVIPRLSKLKDLAKLMRTPAGERLAEQTKIQFDDAPLNFLLAMIKKESLPKVYKKYIVGNEINVSDPLIAQFKEDNLEDGPWDDAIKQVLMLVNNNAIARLNAQVKKA